MVSLPNLQLKKKAKNWASKNGRGSANKRRLFSCGLHTVTRGKFFCAGAAQFIRENATGSQDVGNSDNIKKQTLISLINTCYTWFASAHSDFRPVGVERFLQNVTGGKVVNDSKLLFFSSDWNILWFLSMKGWHGQGASPLNRPSNQNHKVTTLLLCLLLPLRIRSPPLHSTGIDTT